MPIKLVLLRESSQPGPPFSLSPWHLSHLLVSVCFFYDFLILSYLQWLSQSISLANSSKFRERALTDHTGVCFALLRGPSRGRWCSTSGIMECTGTLNHKELWSSSKEQIKTRYGSILSRQNWNHYIKPTGFDLSPKLVVVFWSFRSTIMEGD